MAALLPCGQPLHPLQGFPPSHMYFSQALPYRLQEIFVHKTQAISERRVEEKCLLLLTLNSSDFIGESAGLGLAGHKWEQWMDVCLLLYSGDH